MKYFDRIRNILIIFLSAISFSCSSGYDIEIENNTNKIGEALSYDCILLDTLFAKNTIMYIDDEKILFEGSHDALSDYKYIQCDPCTSFPQGFICKIKNVKQINKQTIITRGEVDLREIFNGLSYSGEIDSFYNQTGTRSGNSYFNIDKAGEITQNGLDINYMIKLYGSFYVNYISFENSKPRYSISARIRGNLQANIKGEFESDYSVTLFEYSCDPFVILFKNSKLRLPISVKIPITVNLESDISFSGEIVNTKIDKIITITDEGVVSDTELREDIGADLAISNTPENNKENTQFSLSGKLYLSSGVELYFYNFYGVEAYLQLGDSINFSLNNNQYGVHPELLHQPFIRLDATAYPEWYKFSTDSPIREKFDIWTKKYKHKLYPTYYMVEYSINGAVSLVAYNRMPLSFKDMECGYIITNMPQIPPKDSTSSYYKLIEYAESDISLAKEDIVTIIFNECKLEKGKYYVTPYVKMVCGLTYYEFYELNYGNTNIPPGIGDDYIVD